MSEERNPVPLVLIVDDELSAIQLLTHIFERERYLVQSVNNGTDALAIAQKVLPDLILLDIMMPQMNGFEVLVALKQNPLTAMIPIIILTAKAHTPSDIENGFNLGATDYIQRPFNPRVLLARAKSKIRARQFEETLQDRIEELETSIRINEELNQRIVADAGTSPVSLTFEHHIFLSYSRKDEEIMCQIRDGLRTNSLLVWVDQEELILGARSWKKIVEKAIDVAGCVAVILSPDAKASEWVEAELDYAESQGKQFFQS